ncbi:hypothetical protein COLO4_16358 [Corchorus olitorius]|uniref:Uncharacterized protein n=1 Tax=Corchorus olitorius TaxID=93759 RepID=A0A1R3JHU5_9ROSI|nr:hypothetical protein COLO4_16358 [Corchorus olitorius]
MEKPPPLASPGIAYGGRPPCFAMLAMKTTINEAQQMQIGSPRRPKAFPNL